MYGRLVSLSVFSCDYYLCRERIALCESDYLSSLGSHRDSGSSYIGFAAAYGFEYGFKAHVIDKKLHIEFITDSIHDIYVDSVDNAVYKEFVRREFSICSHYQFSFGNIIVFILIRLIICTIACKYIISYYLYKINI